ncbi:unnamed protein product [Aphanomyces euteiches]
MELDGSPSTLDDHPYVSFTNADERRQSTSGRRQNPPPIMRRRSLIETPFFEVNEAAELILKANAPPKVVDGTLHEMIHNVRSSRYCQDQFATIQAQTGMHPTTLRFSPEYEHGFRLYIQKAALKRTRVCFALGFFATLVYFLWDSHRISYSPLTYFLAFGIGVMSFGFGFFLTYVPSLEMHTEALSFTVFLSVAAVLIALKPLNAQRGPVLPLLVLIIPIFGVTRMRFLYSTTLGWTIFVSYIVVQLSSIHSLGPTWDTRSDIFYQSVNYVIALVSGMVSHYRQELLRRRNYALKLPFAGLTSTDCSIALQKEKFSKRNLMETWSMEFCDREVEACFIRHWYLIDPFPFENPNAAVLHQGAFRVIRFSVMTVLVNQVFLAIQDYRLLHKYAHLAEIGYSLRFGVVDVAYASAAIFMYITGQRYYKLWLASNAAHNDMTDTFRPSMSQSSCCSWWNRPYEILSQDDEDTTTSEHVAVEASRKWRVMSKLFGSKVATEQNNRVQTQDVHSAQLYAIFVVALHTTSMAVMMFVVATSPSVETSSDVYFMGFLNAILFANRSGFRVRHKYAIGTTIVVGIATVATSLGLLHPLREPYMWLRYATYITVVLILAGLISREEESLRRSFFVLKSIRSLEFEEWFDRVSRVQDWIRKRLHQKCMALHAKNPDSPKKPRVQKVLVNTGAYLAQASKMGVYGELINVLLVLIDILMKLK